MIALAENDLPMTRLSFSCIQNKPDTIFTYILDTRIEIFARRREMAEISAVLDDNYPKYRRRNFEELRRSKERCQIYFSHTLQTFSVSTVFRFIAIIRL